MSSKLFKKVDSSDYITYKKRQAIASEYVQADTPNELNPLKPNGYYYNENFRFVPTFNTILTDASNCLLQAKNYDLKLDYTSGIADLKVVCKK
jgi:hypothetical protein